MMSQSVDGLLCIDKPSGLTSHDVVNNIRRLTGVRRVGHAGTLDPLATGLLLVCLGRATRLLEYLVGQPKTYLADVELGRETTTYDAEGDIVAEHPVDISAEQLAAALADFRGEITQLAPLYSAVKVDGQPLYRSARKGQSVRRPERQVIIYQLELLDRNDPHLSLRIHCSSGTYVRALAHDLGQRLGCGAYLSGLRRTVIGSFSLEEAVPLAQLQDRDWRAELQPIDAAVQHLSRLDLTFEEAEAVSRGQFVARRPGQAEIPLVRAYDQLGRFVGVLVAQEEMWRPRKILYQPTEG